MHVARIALIAALAFAPAALRISSGQAFASETPATMLEKGIFQEETAGDLDAAVKMYKQIVDEANASRHAVAEAQYRLGVCYQKQGKKDEAQAAFRDLVAKYSDEKDLVAQARKELGEAEPAPTAAKYEPLELNPAPWPDDELMVMKVMSKANAELGTIFYTAKRLDSHGEPIVPALPPTALSDANSNGGEWRIESYQVIPMIGSREYTRVDADAMTFAPITGRTKNTMGDFRATYQAGKVALEATHEGKPTTLDIHVEGTVYDNEQVIYLLRRLPLKEGYTARFPIFPVTSGAVVECRIRVDGRENMLDFGNNTTFPCWKVELSVFSQGVEALQHQLWIEAQGERHLVKYDSGTAVLQLVNVGSFALDYPKPGESYWFPDSDDIRLKRLPGWFGCFDHLNPAYKFSLQLLPPELKAWASFIGAMRPAGMDARQIAEGDVTILKGFFKNYAVRADSWVDVTVSGLKGARFVADYEDKDRAMVEYRTYIITPTTVVWFVFRADKDQFDALRPEFDKVVQSLNAPEWTSGPDAEYLTLCTQAILATLPTELKVRNLNWHGARESKSGKTLGWMLNPLTFSADEQRQREILPERIEAIKSATIFSEKIPFVTDAGFGADPPLHLYIGVISREEAEKRREAAQHETK